jgi:hypothetical protein
VNINASAHKGKSAPHRYSVYTCDTHLCVGSPNLGVGCTSLDFNVCDLANDRVGVSCRDDRHFV